MVGTLYHDNDLLQNVHSALKKNQTQIFWRTNFLFIWNTQVWLNFGRNCAKSSVLLFRICFGFMLSYYFGKISIICFFMDLCFQCQLPFILLFPNFKLVLPLLTVWLSNNWPNFLSLVCFVIATRVPTGRSFQLILKRLYEQNLTKSISPETPYNKLY